jgi:hypothetical protein
MAAMMVAVVELGAAAFGTAAVAALGGAGVDDAADELDAAGAERCAGGDAAFFEVRVENAIDDTQQATEDSECEADDNVGRHELEPKRLREKN